MSCASNRARACAVALVSVVVASGGSTRAELGALGPQRIEETAAGERLAQFSSRTVVAAIEVDRASAHLVAYTVKPRAYVRSLAAIEPRAHDEGPKLQLEIVLSNGALGETRRIDVGPLCFVHGGETEAHITGDRIVLHRDAVLVELPELAGFDRLEVAYHERDHGALVRHSLGELRLDAGSFDPAGGELSYATLAFADPEDRGQPTPTAATVKWPEDFGDTAKYLVFGDEAENVQRINMVIVPDGYRYQDKALMEIHAAAMVQAFRNKTPYKQHDPFMSYTLVYAYSTEAGTDQCDCGVVTNTAMGTRFPLNNPTCGSPDNRCLYYGQGCDTIGTSNIVAAELRAPFHDETVVMVNTTRYGGCGGERAAYSAANGSAVEIAIHEVGHSLGGLADEYAYNSGCGSFAGEINTSKNAVSGAWPEWIDDLGLPRQGAEYFQQCLYRPLFDCEMRNLGPPFCPVCNQRWSLVTFGHPRVSPTAPLESKSPSGATSAFVGVPAPFSITTRLSDGPDVTNSIVWKLKGPGPTIPVVVATGTESYTHTFTQPGFYTLSVELIADTNYVKPVKTGANRDLSSWTIGVSELEPPEEVSPPGSPDPLLFETRTLLSWQDASAAGADSYNVYRGPLSELGSGAYGECFAAGVTPTSIEDTQTPAPAAGFFYLVAGVNAGGEGPLGESSSGVPQESAAPCE